MAGKENERGIGRNLFVKKEDNDEDGEGEDKKKKVKTSEYTAHVAVSSEAARNKQNESLPRLCALQPDLFIAGNIL